MPEKVTVTIDASSAHPDVLTVEDAMRQVLDFFDLLTGGDSGVEWRLSLATKNSPFHVEAEAVSFEPSVDITVVARAQKQIVSDGLREIADGHIPAWDDKRLKTAKRFYERNLNGIGSTEIDFQQGGKINVTPRFAQTAISVLAKAPKIDLYDFPRLIKGEVGSIEGVFAHLSTYRNQPAIGIIDARTKNLVWCVLSPELQAKFSDKADFNDFWKHRRVMVRGRIRYNASRSISFAVAEDISRIEPKAVPLTAIKDPNFTGGLSTSEYLDRFREGALGG